MEDFRFVCCNMWEVREPRGRRRNLNVPMGKVRARVVGVGARGVVSAGGYS